MAGKRKARGSDFKAKVALAAFAGYQTVQRQVIFPIVPPDGRPVGDFRVNVRLRGESEAAVRAGR